MRGCGLGALVLDGASPTVRDVIAVGNHRVADPAGGEAAEHGEMGGAFQLLRSKALLLDCVAQGNSARDGGAVHALGGAPELVGLRLEGNKARRYGGAVFARDSGLTLRDSVLFNNTCAVSPC